MENGPALATIGGHIKNGVRDQQRQWSRTGSGLENFQDKIRRLIAEQKVRVSEHGYDELSEDGLTAREIIAGIEKGFLIEDYPTFAKGPCALFLQHDSNDKPVHVVWGVPKNHDEPAVLITAYRPDPKRWDRTYRKRLKP